MKKIIALIVFGLAFIVFWCCLIIHQRNIDNAYGLWADQTAQERIK